MFRSGRERVCKSRISTPGHAPAIELRRPPGKGGDLRAEVLEAGAPVRTAGAGDRIHADGAVERAAPAPTALLAEVVHLVLVVRHPADVPRSDRKSVV